MFNNSRSYSIRLLMVIIIFMAMLMILVNAGFYFGLNQLLLGMTPGANIKLVIPVINVEIITQSLSDVVKTLNILSDNFFVWIVPATALFFLISAIILWFIMKIFLSISLSEIASMTPLKSSKAISESGKSTSESGGKKEDKEIAKEGGRAKDYVDHKDHADQRMEQERQRRLFLHFLSVLQREGRILDFFSEDLTLYDDEQIGAAVRSIQEDCKKTVQKYLAPIPVLTNEEGEMVDIQTGFDPDAIKLIGNVSGEPPFKGILRHRGWKAGKKEVPKLSDILDSSIISPAEVEIE